MGPARSGLSMFTYRYVWFLAFCCLSGSTNGLSSEYFRERHPYSLTPEWIGVSTEQGARNISVRYRTSDDAVALWWLNGKLITEGDMEYHVTHASREHRNIHGDVDLRICSVVIPGDEDVAQLHLQLITEGMEVMLEMHVQDVAEGSTIQEYIPDHEFKIRPDEDVTYDEGDDIVFITHFTTDTLGVNNVSGMAAQFISITNSTTPPTVNVKTNDLNPEFMDIQNPSMEEIHYSDLVWFRNPRHKFRRLEVHQSGEALNGILKFTAWFSENLDCFLFAGIKITRFAFIRPSSSSKFFPENTSVFMNPVYVYSVRNGGNLDAAISALGGSEKGEWYTNYESELPSLTVKKGREAITDVETIDIKRLFHREVILRFRNVTSRFAGRYRAVSKVGEGRERMNFNICVQNIC